MNAYQIRTQTQCDALVIGLLDKTFVIDNY